MKYYSGYTKESRNFIGDRSIDIDGFEDALRDYGFGFYEVLIQVRELSEPVSPVFLGWIVEEKIIKRAWMKVDALLSHPNTKPSRELRFTQT